MSRRRKMQYGAAAASTGLKKAKKGAKPKKMQAAGAKRPPETKADPSKVRAVETKKDKYVMIHTTPIKNRRQKEEAAERSKSVYQHLKDKYDTYKGVKSLDNLKPPKKRAGGSSFIEKSKEIKFGGPSYKAQAGTSPREKAQNQPQGSSAKDKQGNVVSFNDAFAAARKRLGPGKTFMYRGKKYSTNRADDKQKVTKPDAAPAAIKKKSATTVKSSVKKPGLQTRPTPAPAPAPKAEEPRSRRERRRDRQDDRRENRRARQDARSAKREARRDARGSRKADRQAGRASRPSRAQRKADRLTSRAERAQQKVADRRASSTPRDTSKLDRDLEKLNQMQDGGTKEFKSTIGKGRGPMTNKKTVKPLPKKTLKTPGPNQKGLKKLPTSVRNKMGYARYGGGKKKAMFGMIGKVKGAIDGAKGAEGGLGQKLMGAAKGALGGGMLGRAVGAVKGAAGGGGLKGAMQGFKQGAFGSAGGGAAQTPAATGGQVTARYGGKKSKMKNRRKSRRR